MKNGTVPAGERKFSNDQKKLVFFCQAFDPIAIKCCGRIMASEQIKVQAVVLPGESYSWPRIWATLRGMGARYFFRKLLRDVDYRLRHRLARLHLEALGNFFGGGLSVLDMALKSDCPLLVMKKREQERIQKALLDMRPDLIITCSFPIILKKIILEIPKLGGLNVHPALLPRYRGPNPIFWALFNEEKYTGVSIHRLSAKIDEGDVLLQKKIKISAQENLDSLTDKIADAAAELLSDLLQDDGSAKIVALPQDSALASYQPRPDVRQMKLLRSKLSAKDRLAVTAI